MSIKFPTRWTVCLLSLFAVSSVLAQDKGGTPSDGNLLSKWINHFRDNNPEIRANAVIFVQNLQSVPGRASPFIPVLTNLLLNDKEFRVRSGAAGLLGGMRGDSDKVIPALRQALKSDKDTRVRGAVIYAMERLKSPSIAPDLVKIIEEDPDAHVRASAISALSHLNADAKIVVPVLVRALRDGDAEIREASATGLGSFRREPLICVPPLTKMLKDNNGAVRNWSAWALGEFGNEAKSALPELLKSVDDTDPNVRVACAHATWKIDKHPRAIRSLIVNLRGHGAVSAAWALSEIGPKSRSAVPSIIKVLESDDAHTRSSIAQILGTFPDEAALCVPALIRALKDKDLWVRRSAADALAKLGSNSKPAVRALEKALEDSDQMVCVRVAISLWKIEKHRATIPALVRCLNSPQYSGNLLGIADALGEIGPEAKVVLRDLELASYCYPEYRAVFEAAVKRISP